MIVMRIYFSFTVVIGQQRRLIAVFLDMDPAWVDGFNSGDRLLNIGGGDSL